MEEHLATWLALTAELHNNSICHASNPYYTAHICKSKSFISSVPHTDHVLFCLHFISNSPISLSSHFYLFIFLFFLLLLSHQLSHKWMQKLFIGQMQDSHTYKPKLKNTRRLSNTTLSTWMKTHSACWEKHKWLTMPENARAYMHTHTLVHLLNTLVWYPFSSEMHACWCVYISVNVRVCKVTLEKRHCESTEG